MCTLAAQKPFGVGVADGFDIPFEFFQAILAHKVLVTIEQGVAYSNLCLASCFSWVVGYHILGDLHSLA